MGQTTGCCGHSVLGGSTSNSLETFSSANLLCTDYPSFLLKLEEYFCIPLYSVHGTKPGKYENESQKAKKGLAVVSGCSVLAGDAPVPERGEL